MFYFTPCLWLPPVYPARAPPHEHLPAQASHFAARATRRESFSAAPLLGQHEGGRHAHVRAALRHRLRAEGPVAGRALLALLDDGGQAAVADEG
eukprot:scaffold81038_cov91-Phaeocystis_antarctica.AAC.1